LTWEPKYRNWVVREGRREKVKKVFLEVGEHHEYEIEEVSIASDHVRLFLSISPKNSNSHAVGVTKSIS
jgi:putative transposase